MLVLSRKKNERILLPELGVSIMVIHCDKHRARLGIKAPDGIAIVREELKNLPKREKPA